MSSAQPNPSTATHPRGSCRNSRPSITTTKLSFPHSACIILFASYAHLSPCTPPLGPTWTSSSLPSRLLSQRDRLSLIILATRSISTSPSSSSITGLGEYVYTFTMPSSCLGHAYNGLRKTVHPAASSRSTSTQTDLDCLSPKMLSRSSAPCAIQV